MKLRIVCRLSGYRRDFFRLSADRALGNQVLILPVQPTSRLFRSLTYDGPAVSLEDMDRAVAEGATEG